MAQRRNTSTILKYTHIHNNADYYFGDQKYVTEQMLREFAENDEYELQQIKELWDSTDPEIRQWQNPIPRHNDSYGIVFGEHDGDNTYHFSDETKFHGSTYFKNFNTIDKNKTTAFIDTEKGKASIPVTTELISSTNTKNEGPWGGMQANELWYIGFDKSKTYTPAKYKKDDASDLDQDGIQDYLDSTDIPAICRAQKFKAKETGYLKTITLNLKGDKDAECPLIIEIYEWTTDKDLPILDKTKKLATTTYSFNVTSSALTAITFDSPAHLEKDKEYFFILRSPLTSYGHAYGVGGWSNSCYLDKTKLYKDGEAFLSENNGYSWIKHGKTDKKLKYHNGQQPPVSFAFTCHIEESKSTYPTDKEYSVYFKCLRMNPIKHVQISPIRSSLPDEESTSIEYYISQDGKTWKNIETEEDYGEDEETIYNNSNSTYLYLRVDFKTSNSSVTPSLGGLVVTADTLPAHKAYFKTSIFNPRTSPMLGAAIWSGVYTPYQLANTTENSNNVDVKVDIYRDQVIKDHFKFITPSDIKDYTFTETFVKKYYNTDTLVDLNEGNAQHMTDSEANVIALSKKDDGSDVSALATAIQSEYNTLGYLTLNDEEVSKIVTKLNTELSVIETEEDALDFIEEYPLIINQLHEYHIYLVGTYQIPLSKPAVKYLLSANFKPAKTENTTKEPDYELLSEDHDFIADYDMGVDYIPTDEDGEVKLFYLTNNLHEYNSNLSEKTYAVEDYGKTVLTFLEPTEEEIESNTYNTLYKLTPGDLEVEYMPLFIKGLTMDVFYKYDSNGNIITNSNGVPIYQKMPLDIMVDDFIYDGETIDFDLSVDPVCALRRVLINEGYDDEKELFEDVDFTVDYDNKRLKLKYSDLISGDLISVRYTPNLTDTGLGIAYRMTRKDNLSQAYILPSYWQFRV